MVYQDEENKKIKLKKRRNYLASINLILQKNKKMENEKISELDKSNLRQVILDGADQFAEGIKLAQNIKLEGGFDSITISGMGGSALPGNILRIFINDLLSQKSEEERKLAVYQNRFYSLPPEAYQNSLNFICSFSGNTEETISSFQEALDSKLPCVGISSGGVIEKMCKENSIPHVKLPIPTENFQPRMATGYFFSSIFQLLVNAGLMEDRSEQIIEISHKLGEETKNIENQGKELAKKLVGKTPVIYSSAKFKSIAMIWKIKLNENSKTPAFWNFFPELNHNEMIGFTNPQADYFILMLRDGDGNQKNIKRFEITSQILKKKNIDSEIIEMEGENIFYKIFATLYLGDWVSYYLALEYNQDPTPVDMVEEFKNLLK